MSSLCASPIRVSVFLSLGLARRCWCFRREGDLRVPKPEGRMRLPPAPRHQQTHVRVQGGPQRHAHLLRGRKVRRDMNSAASANSSVAEILKFSSL